MLSLARLKPVEEVLERYAHVYRPARVEALGNAGGFSGAELWKIHNALGAFCLRSWPSGYPTAEELSLIHRALEAAERGGLNFVPAPVRTLTGESFVSESDGLWELTRWMAGRADFHSFPSRARLRAALGALAELHVAAAGVAGGPGLLRGRGGERGCSPGLKARLAELAELIEGEGERLRRRVGDGRWAELDRLAGQMIDLVSYLAPRLMNRVRTAAEISVPLQVCLRDVWHDHILFERDEVSGIIDFGAMGVDCVSGDLVRLLGSLVGDDREQWEVALEAYEAVRPLSPEERAVLPVFDVTAVLLGGWTWLRWHYVERREFGDRGAAMAHFEALLRRLSRLAEREVEVSLSVEG